MCHPWCLPNLKQIFCFYFVAKVVICIKSYLLLLLTFKLQKPEVIQ